MNYRKKTVKNTNTWRLNNTLLNNQEIIGENKRGKLGKAPKDRCQHHGGVRCSFNLPPLIYNSKTSLTQQMFLCPTHRDAGEFHTSVHLKVGGLEHIEETEPGKSRGGACDPGPLAMGTEPQRAW